MREDDIVQAVAAVINPENPEEAETTAYDVMTLLEMEGLLGGGEFTGGFGTEYNFNEEIRNVTINQYGFDVDKILKLADAVGADQAVELLKAMGTSE